MSFQGRFRSLFKNSDRIDNYQFNCSAFERELYGLNWENDLK